MKQKSLLRNKKYDLSLLDKLKNKSRKNEYIELDGVNVKITSQRYQVFKNSSTCCECGMKAEFLATECPTSIQRNGSTTENYHINMYGIDETTGEEILFTKDHILPKSQGGKNRIDNYQTMCVRCNHDKGNKLTKEQIMENEKCIFCEKQKDRNKVIGETRQFYLIYDEFPVSEGHILVISKEHRVSYTDLSELEKIDLTQGIDLATTIIKSTFNVTDLNIGINQGEVAGQSVMHFHCHVIPRRLNDVKNPKGGVRGVIPTKKIY